MYFCNCILSCEVILTNLRFVLIGRIYEVLTSLSKLLEFDIRMNFVNWNNLQIK